ncbi:hypothetical protein [Paracoccus shanxieyensis]|uniref:Uncharacterized protein n=1 Tax=Paracoccus shanxieyensis TaxID=2675752 RepID=A0A6L6IY83_9RHOB|nr:hypothetical protein [Paracoccus shanxieyensis]MTH64859.1 hypothetical protein [Paracoccus shanxieyensis]MTH87908.1 hypothetical protein [Paracoccus shanxieyensis]
MQDRKSDEQRVPAQQSEQDRSYPEGMDRERSQPDHDQTTRPSQRKDDGGNARIDTPTTSRQPQYHGTDASGAASGDPTE